MLAPIAPLSAACCPPGFYENLGGIGSRLDGSPEAKRETKEEAIAYARKYGVAKQIIREADKNGDDKLSRSEVQAYYASREGPPN